MVLEPNVFVNQNRTNDLMSYEWGFTYPSDILANEWHTKDSITLTAHT